MRQDYDVIYARKKDDHYKRKRKLYNFKGIRSKISKTKTTNLTSIPGRQGITHTQKKKTYNTTSQYKQQ